MTQHDYNVANQTMPSARGDINTALQAIQELNAGSSAPSVTFSGQFWADTTTGLLKQRNQANSAWNILYPLDVPGMNLRTSSGNPNGAVQGDFVGQTCYDTTNNVEFVCTTSGSSATAVWKPQYLSLVNAQTGTSYTINATDRFKLVTFSNTASQAITLPAGSATNFKAGYFVDVSNINTGTVTITPASGTIDGAASLIMLKGDSLRLVTDGTNWFTVKGKNTSGAYSFLASNASARGGAGALAFNFTSNIDSTYDHYIIAMVGLQPTSDTQDLYMRISQDGGSSWGSGAADYHYNMTGSIVAGSNVAVQSGGAAQILMSLTSASNYHIGNFSAKSVNGEIHFYLPADTALNKKFNWHLDYETTAAVLANVVGSGGYKANTGAINGVSLFFSAANITGAAYLYGVKNA